jgi:three-Cys-motif partner protein
MAVPTTTLWDRDPHTAAKHQMLSTYLQAWFPIIASGFGSSGLTYVDAFAGPGEYTGHEPGSPLIALQQACRSDVCKNGRPIRLLFIEESTSRVDHLRGLIEGRYPERTRPQTVMLRTVHGSCEDKLVPLLGQIGASAGPVFVNFDGWGVDTPMSLVRHVSHYPSPEVLITFERQWFLRFASRTDVAAGDVFFGDDRWRPLASTGSPAEKKRSLIDDYRRRLATAGFKFSLVFEMFDEEGHELLLVYGTGNILGLEKMKDAMWSVDRVHGERFRDPRDVGQLSFEMTDKPDLALLKKQLLVVLGQGRTNMAALKHFALTDTVFKATHVPGAIAELRAAHEVECQPAKRHEDYFVYLPTQPTLFA